MRPVGPWLAVAAALGTAGCPDGDPIHQPPEPEPPGLVSNPVSGGPAAARAAGSSNLGAEGNLAYVSLPPDSIPNGEIATIRNTRTGRTANTAMADGGFDPIAVEASAGDRLALEILVSGGGAPVHVDLEVPEFRKPRVVRTRPAVRKRDVVLNAVPFIVFSEPISGQTISPTSVQLLRDGVPVVGRATVTPDGLRAEFQPDQLLAPSTTYVLTVTTGVQDLTGDALEGAVETEFTTGTTTAVAMVYTDPAALFTVLNGELRTWTFEATLHDDGRVTGSFNGFNPSSGGGGFGRITCFSIVDGRKAWVGGVFDELRGPNRTFTEVETGWIALDNGSPDGSVADQLTFAIGLSENGFGTPQDFCDNTPPGPTQDGLWLRDLDVGNIVVQGSAPPGAGGALRRFSGDQTVGAINTAVAEPFRVYVVDGEGNTVSGVPIEWAVTAGGGSITPAQDVTSDLHGVGHTISAATLTLGPEEGTHMVTATAPTLPGAPPITFSSAAVTVLVQVTDTGFVPSAVTVPLGRSVGWLYSSRGASVHNVTFEDEPPQPASAVRLGPGMSRSRAFGTVGTVRYRCTFHSSSFTEGEVGTVTVEDPTPPPPGPGPAMQWDLVADWKLWPTHGEPQPGSVWPAHRFHPLTSYNTAGLGVPGAESWKGPFESTGPFDMLPHIGINSTTDWQYFSSLEWSPEPSWRIPTRRQVSVVGWQSPSMTA